MLLKTSGITKAEVIDNSDAVLDVLNFNDHYRKQQEKGVSKPTGKAKPTPQPPVAQAQPPTESGGAASEFQPVALPEENQITLSNNFGSFV